MSSGGHTVADCGCIEWDDGLPSLCERHAAMRPERLPFRHGNEHPAPPRRLFTAADAVLVNALADLAESTEPRRRAGHLVKPARALAARIDRACPPLPSND